MDFRVACGEVSEQLTAGRPLWECLAPHPVFPRGLRPFLQLSDQTPNLAASFRAAAEMFEGRALPNASLLAWIGPPLAFIVIYGVVATFIVALFMPLIGLIQKLSG